MDNEPLGHTLDLVGELDRDMGPDSARLHVLIHPHPTAAPTDDQWAEPGNEPTWLSTLLRSDHLQRTQSLYDDLRRVEKTNTKIAWLGQFLDAVVPTLESLDDETKQRIAGAVQGVTDSFTQERSSLPGHDPGHTRNAALTGTGRLRDVLGQAVAAIAGVDDKRVVGLEVISPLVLPDAQQVPIEEMLAGEILFHFGGFFDTRLRDSDFDLGYSSTLEWLKGGGLTRHGLDDRLTQTAFDAAANAYVPKDAWREWGQKTLSFVAGRHPFALAGLLAQIARVTATDAIIRHKQ